MVNARLVEVRAGRLVAELPIPVLEIGLGVEAQRFGIESMCHLCHQVGSQASTPCVDAGANPPDAKTVGLAQDPQVTGATGSVGQPQMDGGWQQVASVDVDVIHVLFKRKHRVTDTPDEIDVLGAQSVARAQRYC